MSDPQQSKVTVEELLPALIELASIQSDLLRTLEQPKASFFGRSAFRAAGAWADQPQPVGIDTGALQSRVQVLLRWLLEKAGALPADEKPYD